MSIPRTALPFKLEIVDDPDQVTSRAGLPLLLELLRVLFTRWHYQQLAEALAYKSWKSVRRHMESLILLIADGGEHLSDLDYLRGDKGLLQLSGFKVSSPTQAKDFLYRFHQASDGTPLTEDDDRRLSVKGSATIRPEGPGLLQLSHFLSDVVAHHQQLDPHRVATIDVDATIIEAHKRVALKAYEGTVGYQPQGAYWAEQGIWVGEEFRDGNVPAQFRILDFVQRVYANLPEGIQTRKLRGDSALYDEGLLTWLADQQIGFAVSADMSQSLADHIKKLPEKEWKSYSRLNKDGTEVLLDTEERQWAEVVFVPNWKRNQKKTGEPFRYIAIRVRSRQLSLLGDADNPWRHFAVVTNLPETQRGDLVLRWHRRKQGTVEFANGVIKNDLAGSVMPCARFGSNAAWWRLNAIVQNLLEMLKLALPDEMALARPKTLRFRLFRFAGRLVRRARQWTLRIWSCHPLAEAMNPAREMLWRWKTEVFVPS